MAKCQVNPNNEIMCCLSCGRDTESSSGICYRCGSPYGFQVSDQKGRKILKIDGDPAWKYDPEDQEE